MVKTLLSKTEKKINICILTHHTSTRLITICNIHDIHCTLSENKVREEKTKFI